jgi:predicted nucleic acid-binding protein
LKTAVDSSIILSIFKGEHSGRGWLKILKSRRRESSLIACEVVIAETRPASPSDKEHLDRIRQLGLACQPMSEEAACHAGALFRAYRHTGGSKGRILPDFLIGAHALIDADELVTDDKGFMRKYFDGLKIVTTE